MRVSMKYNGIPTSCEAFSYGQVEDYTINIQAAVADSTAPSAPANLAASGTTQTTTNLSWTASTDNVGVTGYDVYQNGAFKANTASTSYAVTGLTSATAYSFYIIARDAAGNSSAQSNTVNVTTLSGSVAYCTSQGNNTADERIGRVAIGTINNPSTGTAGYENFTALSASVNRSTAYTITVTPAWTSTVYPEGYAVFVDYNQDGDFADAGETVWTKAASTTTPVSGTFTIPATATLGSTRIRVSMKYNGVPTACEAFSYGQVEDYTLVIGSGAKAAEMMALNVYPNPVTGNLLNISVQGKTAYRILNLTGQVLAKGETTDGAVNLPELNAGVYLIEATSGEKIAVKRFIKQ
ncbi:MAG: T9SS type A sorting domain-containing protein [Flavobacterium sp.]|nr:MAG: T9SS type A sorting domain-containing protein [Flavobacterium sp.]